MTKKREIKFRGFHRDENGKEKVFVDGLWINGFWVYGNLQIDNDLEYYCINGFNYYSTAIGLQREPFEHEVIPKTVGQYTGLKDKNGKEIFEDSLVKDSDGQIYKVVWQPYSAAWQLRNKTTHCLFVMRCMETFEVIGNIYENPEMVGVG